MPILTWTTAALGDLDRLEAFLFENSPPAAARAMAAIMLATRTLAEFPEAGTMREDLDPGHRELLVRFSGSGDVVHYQVDGDRVEILDVRHMREDS
jgi:plasmid stabilization system protein ParE